MHYQMIVFAHLSTLALWAKKNFHDAHALHLGEYCQVLRQDQDFLLVLLKIVA